MSQIQICACSSTPPSTRSRGYSSWPPTRSNPFIPSHTFCRGIEVEFVQTGNAFEFINRFSNSKHDLSILFEKTAAWLGIWHRLIRPYTMRHNGKVERRYREDQKRFYPCHFFCCLGNFAKPLAVHNRYFNSLPMRSTHWMFPAKFTVQYV